MVIIGNNSYCIYIVRVYNDGSKFREIIKMTWCRQNVKKYSRVVWINDKVISPKIIKMKKMIYRRIKCLYCKKSAIYAFTNKFELVRRLK
jgi:hypothetical protein